ncbi:hypothetical protein [Nonomuraea maritima]|uniref:hypothetical protein n=1 Tax=Nonomuraea maritima TaxID=683260 RepID=UPI0037178BA6
MTAAGGPGRGPVPRRRLGDVPMKVVYLLGAIAATVLAVVLVFTVFSGDVPARHAAEEQFAGVAPVPTVTATPTPSASPTPTQAPIVLPPVPASKTYATFPGTASVVVGLVNDERTGISYPKLAAPWQAVKSPSPFSAAQQVGKAVVPHTQIASAMLPGDAPKKKPVSDADYRAIAAQAVRWTMRTQFPKGATLAWTASQRLPVGKGWTLGYKVTYTSGGKKRQAQAMVTVVEVGKTKPAMLMANMLDTDKARWPDLNTLVQRVRPL